MTTEKGKIGQVELNFYLLKLVENAKIIKIMLDQVENRQTNWKPAPNKWSVLEVINHLYDEERLDFRLRLQNLLAGVAWQPIDPSNWVIAHKYNEQNFKSSIDNFLNERDKSISWLNELSEVDWNTAYDHPNGPIRAGDLLVSWVAHDLLHIRQITRLHFEYLTFISMPFSPDYAGEW